MDAKKFFKTLSWLLLLNLLIKPAWIFLIDRQVQNKVGHEAYGTYFSFFNLTYVLLFLADAGLTSMLLQRLAANETVNVRQLALYKLLLFLLYAGTCTGIAALSGNLQWPMLGYLVTIQGFSSLFLFLRGILAARQYFQADAYFSVLDKFLLFLLCAGPVYGLFQPINILLFLQLQTLSITAATGALVAVLFQKKCFTGGRRMPARQLAILVAPFVVLVMLMAAHNRLDAFLLERLHPDGAAQAGIYAMGYRLLDAANMLGYLTASFLVPYLARNSANQKLTQKVVLLSRHGLLFIAALCTAFIVIFSPWVERVLYHSNTPAGSRVILLCLLALPAYYLVHVYGSLFTARALFRPFILVLSGCVLLNMLLNLWLIPDYGAMGCCMAALATQYSCGLLLWLIASKKFSVAASFATAAFYPCLALIFGLLFYAGQLLTSNPWLIAGSTTMLLGFLLLAGKQKIEETFLTINN